MNKLALDFWDMKGIGIAKLVAMGKAKGIPDYKIKNAAEIVYQEITDGKKKDNIKIALAVVNLAQKLDSKKYEDDQRLISDASTTLEGIKAQIEIVNKAKEEEHDDNMRLCSQIQELKYENNSWLVLCNQLKGEKKELIADHAKRDILMGAIFIFSVLLTIFLGAIF